MKRQKTQKTSRKAGTFTELHDAATTYDADAVERLLADGADPNALEELGRTPLALLGEQCDLTAGGGYRFTPETQAKIDRIRELLGARGGKEVGRRSRREVLAEQRRLRAEFVKMWNG